MVPSDHDSLEATRAFFGPKAANWEVRFPDDEPAYEAAVAELGLRRGDCVLDAACGTGRALPILRRRVGPEGRVVGLDVTPEMLAEAARRGRQRDAGLLLADACRLPLPDGCLDAILAAGLIPHLADPDYCLRELRRVARPEARLGLFHPVGRAALAARHNSVPRPDDIRRAPAIRALLERTGWRAEVIDDRAERYLVVASGAMSCPERLIKTEGDT
jgi:SAM-dependent methyltransferase